ncbi:ubiquitin carboxyl-terminal hydrolase 9 [Tanacetum coccineum]
MVMKKNGLAAAGKNLHRRNNNYEDDDDNVALEDGDVEKEASLALSIALHYVTSDYLIPSFHKDEPLGPDDMWYCPGCKEQRQVTKKLDLWRMPDIIVFHLKRFSYSLFLKNKRDTFVNFPIHNIDLSKYVKSKDSSGGSSIYELYAISNHYGGLGGVITLHMQREKANHPICHFYLSISFPLNVWVSIYLL